MKPNHPYPGTKPANAPNTTAGAKHPPLQSVPKSDLRPDLPSSADAVAKTAPIKPAVSPQKADERKPIAVPGHSKGRDSD